MVSEQKALLTLACCVWAKKAHKSGLDPEEEEKFKIWKLILIILGDRGGRLLKMPFKKRMERQKGWRLGLGIKDNSDLPLSREI